MLYWQYIICLLVVGYYLVVALRYFLVTAIHETQNNTKVIQYCYFNPEPYTGTALHLFVELKNNSARRLNICHTRPAP